MKRFYMTCTVLMALCFYAAGYTLDDGTNLVVTNVWDVAGEQIIIGDISASNTLTILSGGTVTNLNSYIGNTAAADENRAVISGSNAFWRVEGNMIVGNAGSTNNTLSVSNDGVLEIGQDLTINPGNKLELASNGHLEIDGDMTVDHAIVSGTGTIQFGDGMNTLSISGSNSVISSTVVFDAGAGEDSLFLSDLLLNAATFNAQYVDFESIDLSESILSGNGTIGVMDGSVSISNSRLNLDGVLSVEGDLVLTDIVLAIDLGVGRLEAAGINGLDVSSVQAVVSVLPDQEVHNLTNAIISAGGGVSGWVDGDSTISENYLLYDFSFSTTTDSVDVVSAPVDGNTLSSTLTYAGSEGVRAGFNGMKNTVFTRTKQLRRNLVATQHLLPSAPAEAPEGAQGPGDRNVIYDVHLWMEYFSGAGDQDAYGVSDAFRMYNRGSSIGLDRLIGDAMIIGLNYTHALSDARADNGDAIDVETFWFGAYGEWVSKGGLYVDALAAYGTTDYAALRQEKDYSGRADYDGGALGACLDVGQYYYVDRLALAPYAGLHLLAVTADAHTETEAGGGTLQVDEEERFWMESAVGLKARHRMDTRLGRLQTSLYAEWVHDFEQEDVQTVLADGSVPPVGLAVISPDKDVLNTGLGLSWFRSDVMEIGIGYHGRFSEHYEEHAGSLMLDVMF